MERLLFLAVMALMRVIKNKGLTEPGAVLLEKSKYEKRNNPIKLFLEDHDVIDRSSREMHQVYNVWCRENGYQAMSIYEFSSEICRQTGLETKRIRVDGKQMAVFKKVL
jgi:putative DNA primase/helicase